MTGLPRQAGNQLSVDRSVGPSLNHPVTQGSSAALGSLLMSLSTRSISLPAGLCRKARRWSAAMACSCWTTSRKEVPTACTTTSRSCLRIPAFSRRWARAEPMLSRMLRHVTWVNAANSCRRATEVLRELVASWVDA